MRVSSRWRYIACGLWLSACVGVPESEPRAPQRMDASVAVSADGGGLLRPPNGQPYTGPECESGPVPPHGSGGANAPAAANGHAGAAASSMRDGGAEAPVGAGADVPDLPHDPDVLATPRPIRGALVITEVMSNPEAVRDDAGEWFELYNPSESDALTLAGCAVDDGAERPRLLMGELVIEPLGYAVIARSAEVGFVPDAILSLSLANTEDRLALICDGVEIDRVSYGPGYPLVPGASLALDPGASDAIANDSAAAWCSGTGGAGGDRGTPGSANASCEQDGADAGS